jgi:hypothetical protein
MRSTDSETSPRGVGMPDIIALLPEKSREVRGVILSGDGSMYRRGGEGA